MFKRKQKNTILNLTSIEVFLDTFGNLAKPIPSEKEWERIMESLSYHIDSEHLNDIMLEPISILEFLPR